MWKKKETVDQRRSLEIRQKEMTDKKIERSTCCWVGWWMRRNKIVSISERRDECYPSDGYNERNVADGGLQWWRRMAASVGSDLCPSSSWEGRRPKPKPSKLRSVSGERRDGREAVGLREGLPAHLLGLARLCNRVSSGKSRPANCWRCG